MGRTRPTLQDPNELFTCEALHCRLTVRCCVMRQQVSDLQRTDNHERGQSPEYSYCVTLKCSLGRANRASLGATRSIGRVRTPDGWLAAQLAARARALRESIDHDTPTLDSPPRPVPAEDDGSSGSEQRQAPHAATPGRQGPALQAGPVREPGRPPKGPLGVPSDGPRAGDRGGDEVPPGGREGRRLQVGGDPARVRVGQAQPGRRGDRQGRRSARGVGCP